MNERKMKELRRLKENMDVLWYLWDYFKHNHLIAPELLRLRMDEGAKAANLILRGSAKNYAEGRKAQSDRREQRRAERGGA